MSKTKEVVVRWQAFYETKLTVPMTATSEDISAMAADINIDVPGSTYQTDTFEVEKVVSVLPHCPRCRGETELSGRGNHAYICHFCGHEFTA